MLLMQPDSWDKLLMGANVQMLQCLSKLGAASNRAREQRHNQHLNSSVSGVLVPTANPHGYRTGFKRLKNGFFWLQVGWRSFKLKPATLLRPEQYEQAVRLHIAMTQVRISARARHKRLANDLHAKVVAVGHRDPLDECPVMTHAELLVLLNEEPWVPLVFATDVHGPSRVESPWTPSLDSANHFLVLMRRAIANNSPIADIKKLMRLRAKHDKEVRASLGREALRRVDQELVRRGAKNPPGSEEQVPPPPPPPPPLAIAEKAHAEIEELRNALQEAKQARVDAEEHADQEAQRATGIELEKQKLEFQRDEALRAAAASTPRLRFRQHSFGGRGMFSSEEHESDMQRDSVRAAARELKNKGGAADRAWEYVTAYPSRRGL